MDNEHWLDRLIRMGNLALVVGIVIAMGFTIVSAFKIGSQPVEKGPDFPKRVGHGRTTVPPSRPLLLPRPLR